jgi:FKBP-type peptidyl-prolyl cis-trans isomerase
MKLLFFPTIFLMLFLSIQGCTAQTKSNQAKEHSAIALASAEAAAALEAYKSNSLGDKLFTTASGLKYVVHQQGSGAKAKSGQYVLVEYYGMLMDGMRFDDSYKNGYPFGFSVGQGQVIAGFDEALTLLPVGSRFTVFIPANLAYSEAGAPPVIPANAELVFHLNFIKIESQD